MKPLCPQINSGVRCDMPRGHGERLCPDCNPQREPIIDGWPLWSCLPPPAVRKPMTDERICKILEQERMKWSTRTGPPTYEFAMSFARAIEAAHGIKEPT
jgi:hypothetical protein